METKNIFKLQAERIFKDLQEDYQNYLEINETVYTQWEDIGNNQHEELLKFPYTEIFSSADQMLLEMGYREGSTYQNFQRWFMDYYELQNNRKWIENWSKAMALNVYKTLEEIECK